MPQNKPINKEPVRFTSNVPVGNAAPGVVLNSFPIQYRKTEPTPPPKKTNKKEMFMVDLRQRGERRGS